MGSVTIFKEGFEMTETTTQYRRKVSAEEVQEGFILVLKDNLEFFPKIDTPFKLSIDNEKHEAVLKAHDVWSVGPRKPQMQYRISIIKFRNKFPMHRGTVVTFTKIKDKHYKLSK